MNAINLKIIPAILGVMFLHFHPNANASSFLTETYTNLGGDAQHDTIADALEVLAPLVEESKTGYYRAVVKCNRGSAVWIGNSATKSYFITVAHVTNAASNTLITHDGTKIYPVSGSYLYKPERDFGLLEYNAVLSPELFGGESLVLMDRHIVDNYVGSRTTLVGYGNLMLGDELRGLGGRRMLSRSTITGLDGSEVYRTRSGVSTTYDPEIPYAGVGTAGDSGGGVFMVANGINTLIGANSAGDRKTGMVYTNIYRYKDFINAVVPEGVFKWYSDVDASVVLPEGDEVPPFVVSLSPTDGSATVENDSDFAATFCEDITAGSGVVTIKNLTDMTESTINITDSSQVAISGATLTINPSSDLLVGKDYAIWMAPSAIHDLSGNSSLGINDDTMWNFTAVASAGDSYADWIASYTGLGGQNSPSDDPDQDGISNMLENYFGTNPGVSNRGLMVEGVSLGGNATFTFTHPISDSPATDITGSYKWTTDLSNYHDSGTTVNETTVTIVEATPVNGNVTITASITGTVPDQFFVNVEVVQEP